MIILLIGPGNLAAQITQALASLPELPLMVLEVDPEPLLEPVPLNQPEPLQDLDQELQSLTDLILEHFPRPDLSHLIREVNLSLKKAVRDLQPYLVELEMNPRIHYRNPIQRMNRQMSRQQLTRRKHRWPRIRNLNG